MRTLRFDERAMQVLRAAVSSAYPEEACGVCVALKDAPDVVTEVRPLANVHPEPRRGFAFDDREHLTVLRELEARGRMVRAFFHSHPDGEATLSAQDRAGALADGEPLWPGVAWVIVTTRGPKVVEVREAALSRFATARPRR